jgi:hypothetical protein
MNDLSVHPMGAAKKQPESDCRALVPAEGPVVLDTFSGRVHVEWDPSAAVTPLGQLAFFTEYLKVGDLFEPWVEQCPVSWTSNNAPNKRDVLGTAVLSILCGHQRYAHISAVRGDTINAALLGMEKVVSEDSVRRMLLKLDETEGVAWLQRHLLAVSEPLLGEAWILDTDVTVKPLFGHQEGAVLGYNPHKPGRPSHTYHTYFIANLRLVLGVEVKPGNQTHSKYSAPGLWELLERIGRARWPALVRGDRDWGTEANMQRCEQEGLAYLFKQRLTKGTKQLIERLLRDAEWTDAGQGWQGAEASLRLSGWSRSRRVVVLRRRVRKDLAIEAPDESGQLRLSFTEVEDSNVRLYEYAVLVTSLDAEILTVAALYRDRADCENNFDELKHHWGWGGFTTRDLKRSRLMARMIALIYNWWSLFARLAEPDKHSESITTRPLLLHAPARQIDHARQRRLIISHHHADAPWVERACRNLAAFLHGLRLTAEQLTPTQRWYRILSRALRKYLHGRELQPPDPLPAPA